MEHSSIKQELISLKKEYYEGVISEQEYQELRNTLMQRWDQQNTQKAPEPQHASHAPADIFATSYASPPQEPHKIKRRTNNIRKGDTINERYQLKELLGEGGMGKVFLAHDQMLERDIALKLIRPELHKNATIRSLFLDELKLTQMLTHPGIVRTYNLEKMQDRDLLYYTMEYIPGKPLHTFFEDSSAGETFFSLKEAFTFIEHLAEAIAYAHKMKVLHRDLKPGNIMVTPDFKAKIMDFGLAKLLHTTSQANDVSGTLFYIAPEHLYGENQLSKTTDIYALGVIAYQLLTGHLPIGWTKAPSQLSSTLPSSIDNIILKAIEPQRSDRYQTAEEFLAALQSISKYTRSSKEVFAVPHVPTVYRTNHQDCVVIATDEAHHHFTKKITIETPAESSINWNDWRPLPLPPAEEQFVGKPVITKHPSGPIECYQTTQRGNLYMQTLSEPGTWRSIPSPEGYTYTSHFTVEYRHGKKQIYAVLENSINRQKHLYRWVSGEWTDWQAPCTEKSGPVVAQDLNHAWVFQRYYDDGILYYCWSYRHEDSFGMWRKLPHESGARHIGTPTIYHHKPTDKLFIFSRTNNNKLMCMGQHAPGYFTKTWIDAGIHTDRAPVIVTPPGKDGAMYIDIFVHTQGELRTNRLSVGFGNLESTTHSGSLPGNEQKTTFGGWAGEWKIIDDLESVKDICFFQPIFQQVDGQKTKYTAIMQTGTNKVNPITHCTIEV